MLRIVVYDGGWGGEEVANYLSEELETVELKRVIDWQGDPYERKSLEEICRAAQKNLAPHIGKVDLIILGGYAVARALPYLSMLYPEQKFVSVGVEPRLIPRSRHFVDQIVLLAGGAFLNTELWIEMQNKISGANLIVPDCSGWDSLIDAGELTTDVIYYELEPYFLIPRHVRQRERARVRMPGIENELLRLRLRERAAHILISNFVFSGNSSYFAEPEREETSLALAVEPAEEEQFYEKLRGDIVVLLDTHFWGIVPEIQEVFGPQVTVVDFRKKLLRDVCKALKLRGQDGKIGTRRQIY